MDASRRWQADNRERFFTKKKIWYANNREKALQDCKTWRENNRERRRLLGIRWRKKNRERFAELNKRWRKDNPERVVEIETLRRARKVGSNGSFTEREWQALKLFYKNRCLCCGKSERQLLKLGRILARDHVVALSCGGGNDISNIQPLCHGRGGCNNRKSTKNTDFRITVRPTS